MVGVRSIINFRLDSLFARVEQLRNPELVGKPVVVGKSAGNSSGIVVSASPEAGALGVCEGQTVRHAQRLCPDGVLISANFALYREYSHRAFDVVAEYSPLVEPQSLDKVFVDVTASRNLFGGPRRIAREALSRIRELGIEAAVGIAGNKFTAEAAAFAAGPGEIKITAPGTEREFLAPLPVRMIWGIGDKTERKLSDLRVRTIGQLAMIPERLLVRRFGPIGSSFHSLSNGIDYTPVLPAYPFEIINTEQMFDNELEEPDQVREHLPQMAERLALELRKRGKLAEHITLKLLLSSESCTGQDEPLERCPEHFERPNTVAVGDAQEFRTARAARDLPFEVAAYRLKRPVNLSKDVQAVADRLLEITMRSGMRLTGVEISLSDLVMGEGIQLSLLGEGERRKRLGSALETVKDKFGEKSIFYAAALAASGRETVLSRVAA